MPKPFSSATATNWQNGPQSVRHFDTGFSLSVVIPAYNEELLLAEAVNNIADVVQSAVADYEIVIVNDGSVDSTLKIARSLAASQPQVIVVDLPQNLGFGGAVKAGLLQAKKDVVIYFPVDYPITPMDLDIYLHLSMYYDIVIGYRRQRRLEMQWKRRMVSVVFHIILNLLFSLNFYDVNWIHAYKRKDIHAYLADSNGVFFAAETLIRATASGYRICGVDVPFVDRTKGVASGAKLSTIIRTGIDVWKFFWTFLRHGRLLPNRR
jgi:glycosyltransferase involved in cell wall biosynthesis